MPSLDLFCRVIDNYGDIGVCWRLARQMRHEHGWQVRLWIDALASFARLCPEVQLECAQQQVQGVDVRHWREPFSVLTPEETGDLVVEGFGCELPESFLQAMVKREPKAAWINLEYLSAEAWVEGCHGLPSTHPALLLKKYFFFPGFTERTGGLLLEKGLPQERRAFVADQEAQSAFLQSLGVNKGGARLVSLFCYPQADVAGLFALMEQGREPTVCVLAEGVASDAVSAFLGQAAVAGACRSRGQLTVQVLPFLRQPDYDRLLWCCDLNFVRGEDSFVRAQWAEKPFIWHIYEQKEDAHLVKLEAFLDLYCRQLAPPSGQALARAMRQWNGAGIEAEDWNALWQAPRPLEMHRHAANWAAVLRSHGDLASNLLRFVKESC